MSGGKEQKADVHIIDVANELDSTLIQERNALGGLSTDCALFKSNNISKETALALPKCIHLYEISLQRPVYKYEYNRI
jgi:hypothetical protein